MKKIGLVIVTYGTNYGTFLQAFATQQAVRSIGFDTEILDINSVIEDVSRARKKYFAKQIFNVSEVKSYSSVLKGMIWERINSRYRDYLSNRRQFFAEFSKEHFCFAPKVDSWEALSEQCRKYDAILVGSDQLWRPANIAGDYYTLNYVPEEINKIAYATSFGLKEIRKNQVQAAKKFLSRIQHLSVREHSGAQIIEELLGRKAPVICDPSMLLDRSQWSEYLDEKPLIDEKYILCYFLGDHPAHRNFARRLSKATGCIIVGVLHIAGYLSVDEDFADAVPRNIGPFEFLNLIKNASYICTDSFHGCLFAALFEKEMFVFKRFSDDNSMSTNDRIITLLSELDLESRLLSGTESVGASVKDKIDYASVQEKIEAKRRAGFYYLSKALADENTDLS